MSGTKENVQEWYGPQVVPENDTVEIIQYLNVCTVYSAWIFGAILICVGAAEVYIGRQVYNEWGSLGAWWAGAVAIVAGLAALFIRGKSRRGGPCTGFALTLAIVTIGVAIFGTLLDGFAFFAVSSFVGCTQGSPANMGPEYSTLLDICNNEQCTCVTEEYVTENNMIVTCVNDYPGPCEEIPDQESDLESSFTLLSFIAVVALASSITACAACCCPSRHLKHQHEHLQAPSA
ncbi:unnamed protein product [Discosporangium mesarthrocarpum]